MSSNNIFYPSDKNGNRLPFRSLIKYVTNDNGDEVQYDLDNISDRIDDKGEEIINSIPTEINYEDDIIELKNESGDILCQTSIPSYPVYPPKNVTNINTIKSGSSLSIWWTDPEDVIIETIPISIWEGTRVIIKDGEPPIHPYDGILVVDETVKNTYKSNSPLRIDLLEMNHIYYIGVFPYASYNTFNLSNENVTSVSFLPDIYGFHINGNDSNPSTSVTYLEKAVNKTPAFMDYTTGIFDWGDWSEDEFFMPRPCMLNYNGTVAYYLNPNDYSKKEDGTASDIANPNFQGNAMMEWGRDGNKIWYKVVPDENDNTSVSVYFSPIQSDPDYHCWSFYDCDNNLRDHFYTPIYNGSLINDETLRSLSGQEVMVRKVGTLELQYARSNNSLGSLTNNRWSTEAFSDITLINYLLILISKSTNSQSSFGYGYSFNNSAKITTGTMNTNGLFWGEITGKAGVKVFGMENYWGNVRRRISGLMAENGHMYVKLTPNTIDNSTTTDYNTTDVTGMHDTNASITTSGYITKMSFSSSGYSVPSAIGGSNLTYYCDNYVYGSGVTYAYIGGCYNDGGNAGFYYFNLGRAISTSYTQLGVSVTYR